VQQGQAGLLLLSLLLHTADLRQVCHCTGNCTGLRLCPQRVFAGLPWAHVPPGGWC
jgi:hypothetical protein